MAEETLVKEPLSAEMISSGERYTQQLDVPQMKLVASFWLYTSAANEWRLVLASPIVDEAGPLKMYSLVREKLAEAPLRATPGPARLSVSVVGVEDPIVKAFRTTQNGRDLRGRRFTSSRIGDQFVEDAYIYLARPST